jgi:predicted transposase/invertase (TIGR01784 family)
MMVKKTREELEMPKTLKDLNLCDDFLFHEVMKDEKLVIELLELILDIPGKIVGVRFLEQEKTIQGSYTGKGVRLDVYVQAEDLTIYEIEMQQAASRSIGKRSRKYQGNIDVEFLKRGEKYDRLKPQYIIFICTFDPFGLGLHRYTFSNLCHEDKGLELGDETTKIFLSTKGTADDVSRDMREFLRFVEHSTAEEAEQSESPLVKKLSQRVEQVKEDEAIGGSFMTLEDKIQDIRWEYEDRLAEKETQLAEKDTQLAA